MPKGIDELPLAFVEKMNQLSEEMLGVFQTEQVLCNSFSHALYRLLEETTGLSEGSACAYEGRAGRLVCWGTASRDWMLLARNLVSLSDMVDSVMGVFKPYGEDSITFITDLSKLEKIREGIYCAG